MGVLCLDNWVKGWTTPCRHSCLPGLRGDVMCEGTIHSRDRPAGQRRLLLSPERKLFLLITLKSCTQIQQERIVLARPPQSLWKPDRLNSLLTSVTELLGWLEAELILQYEFLYCPTPGFIFSIAVSLTKVIPQHPLLSSFPRKFHLCYHFSKAKSWGNRKSLA